eukprot:4286894-Amphidinium_carterae.3
MLVERVDSPTTTHAHLFRRRQLRVVVLAEVEVECRDINALILAEGEGKGIVTVAVDAQAKRAKSHNEAGDGCDGSTYELFWVSAHQRRYNVISIRKLLEVNRVSVRQQLESKVNGNLVGCNEQSRAEWIALHNTCASDRVDGNDPATQSAVRVMRPVLKATTHASSAAEAESSDKPSPTRVRISSGVGLAGGITSCRTTASYADATSRNTQDMCFPELMAIRDNWSSIKIGTEVPPEAAVQYWCKSRDKKEARELNRMRPVTFRSTCNSWIGR